MSSKTSNRVRSDVQIRRSVLTSCCVAGAVVATRHLTQSNNDSEVLLLRYKLIKVKVLVSCMAHLKHGHENTGNHSDEEDVSLPSVCFEIDVISAIWFQCVLYSPAS